MLCCGSAIMIMIMIILRLESKTKTLTLETECYLDDNSDSESRIKTVSESNTKSLSLQVFTMMPGQCLKLNERELGVRPGRVKDGALRIAFRTSSQTQEPDGYSSL